MKDGVKSVGSRPGPGAGRAIGLRLAGLLAGLSAMGLLGGCGATAPGDGPSAGSSPTPGSIATSASSAPSPSRPPDTASEKSGTEPRAGQSAVPVGPTLRELGFQNGPLDDFSLPKGALAVAQVDQPNTVTFVLTEPSPAQVETYLRTTLVKNGFTINARADTGQAMTFSGHGWTGAFTGTRATSAIVLRPAAPR